MNANTLVNRFEILFYTLLISIMSGLNRLRTRVLPITTMPTEATGETMPGQLLIDKPAQPQAYSITWDSIQAIFAPLLLWAVLGFAAGFLIGMIKPW